MGFGLPAAIGARVGSAREFADKKPVWLIDGDGSFQMTSEELATAFLDGTPIKIALLNNSVYGMVRQWQTLFYEHHYSATNLLDGENTPDIMDVPDFVKLAEAYGCVGMRAFTEEEAIECIKKANAINDRPVRPDISRVTVTADVEEVPLEQIIKQLNKLLHVLKIVDLDPNTTVERELVLIKVAADESNRSDVLEIVRLFRVRVVDVNPESLTIEATGAEGKIDALLGLLEHYGIIELVRSGAVAVTRGPKALSEKVLGSEITGR